MNLKYKLEQFAQNKEILHVTLQPDDFGPVGRITYVGNDFIELQVFDPDTGEESQIEVLPLGAIRRYIVGGDLVEKVKSKRILSLAHREPEDAPIVEDR